MLRVRPLSNHGRHQNDLLTHATHQLPPSLDFRSSALLRRRPQTPDARPTKTDAIRARGTDALHLRQGSCPLDWFLVRGNCGNYLFREYGSPHIQSMEQAHSRRSGRGFGRDQDNNCHGCLCRSRIIDPSTIQGLNYMSMSSAIVLQELGAPPWSRRQEY